MRKSCKVNDNIINSKFGLAKIAKLVIFSFFVSSNAFSKSSDNINFNKAFLRSAIDISAYSHGNPVSEGNHFIHVYVNNDLKGRTNVMFKNSEANSSVAQPCFDTKLITMLGIDTKLMTPEGLAQMESGVKCTRIGDLSHELAADYDVSTQQLKVQAPQSYLSRNAKGYINPELWDNGIPAASLQYDYNAWHSEASDNSSFSTQYLGLRGGVNWGAWRLRYRGALNWDESNSWRYNNSNIYLERAIVPLRSKLVLGESSTDGQVFDSIGFRGVMLMSDDRMKANSQRGYAPIVNGIANTNALVRVSQRGTVIYETSVPPGPFTIDDLYPTGTGGDLLVTIKEADGSERSFNVTYASISELLRPGVTHYSVMGGSFHDNGINENPEIFLATVRHGFNNLVTGYTGVLGGKYYQAVSGGVALNTPIGAISSDITYANTILNDDLKSKGHSIRFSFSKILPVVNTNITLASYRYSSSGFYNINDAMLMRSNNWDDTGWQNTGIDRKNRFQFSANQKISDTLGSISINASIQDYWNRDQRDTEYQLGYNNSFKWFNLSVNASRTKDVINNEWQNKIALGISLPLGKNSKAPYLNSTYIHEQGYQGLQNSISGSAGIDQQYNYSSYINFDKYSDTGTQTTGGISGNWTSPWARLGGNFSTSRNYQQYGMQLSGGVIAYSNGLVLTPIMGDTMAIIEAEHAGGAKINNNSSLSLDNKGKAAVPYLTPYRLNTIELNPKGLSNDIVLEETSHNSVPTAGAIVLLKYKTDIGNSVLFNVRHPVQELPFGTPLMDENNEIVGYISQGGRSFVHTKKEKGTLSLKWGTEDNQICQFNYELNIEPLEKNSLRQHDAICQ